MAELRDYLAQLDRDPHDDRVIAAIENMGNQLAAPDAADALKLTRDQLRERGELELVARLFDLEIQASTDDLRIADLLMEQGQLYVEELLNERSGVECYHRVLQLRPEHEEAQEALEELEQVRENWRRLVEKYVEEAQASTDRTLTTYMFQKAAETFARYEPDADEVESYLRRALQVDPRNRKVATHLERLLRRKQRWPELAELYTQRIEQASTKDERIALLVGLADLARERLNDPELAADSMKKVIGAEPGHPRALTLLADHYERDSNWSALVMLYTNALKARRRGSSPDIELGMLLQIAMLHWKRLDNVDAAEEYFRRMRKLAPAHPAALDFYRAYYPARNEIGKLIQALRQALKSAPDDAPEARRALSVEIAQLAEAEMGNAEKAIDAWKAILRAEPASDEAREALKRLYARTEKWNALLDLMKDEVERLAKDDVRGRVSRLLDIVEIYRDRLKLDVMVINTYNSILALEPDNEAALDALAAKYEQLQRWNDLIVVLGRQAEAAGATTERRVSILRAIAGLWIDRFGNFAQAIKPLEQLMEIAPPGSPAMADAVERLKDIYGRRRQWRALIQLLGREAEMLPVGARRHHLAQMATTASDRLGDAKLAIQVWNRVLELPVESAADGPEVAKALAALAGLYEREKRFPAMAEIYRRQRELATDVAEAVAILERLGTLLSERMRAPSQAADVYREILTIEPAHPRALRVMRELYASIGDYDAMERVYSELGQWDELVEAFYGVADRMEDRTIKLRLLERSAAIAAERFNQPEKIARCYERVLTVDPTNVRAARALVPIYARSQKWSRLLSTFQVLLDRADSDDERLELIDSIRDLCEKRLGSKALAFQWTARAYELRPSDARLLADLERLGAEADAWEEVAAILHRRSEDEDTSTEERIRLLRELGRISSVRLHQYDRAQEYLQKLLELRPDDREAIGALEDIATQHSEWPQLLRIYRRKVELESKPAAVVELLFKIAVIEEERVADLDAAAVTYGKILELDGASRRALKALAKLDEARGDWEGLVGVLERELALATDDDTKVALLLRLGSLRENNLDRRYDALAGYKQALALGASNQVYAALERFLDQPGDRAETRVEVAQLLLPEYEKAGDARNISRVLEILRGTATARHQIDIDRRLVKLYRQQNKLQESYDAGVRVLQADFTDADNRAELIRLAEELEIEDVMASELQLALDAAREIDAEPHARRALAAELAVIYEEHLVKPDLAEKAWLEVLEMEVGDGAAYDALDRIYRSAEMWLELRGLLERRFQNTLDPDRRKDILISICQLNEGVLDDVGAAIDSHRRLLEIEPGMLSAYKALERLYAGSQRWPELEQLLAIEISHVGEDQQLELAFRRAELRANQLGDPVGAVDLCEEIAVRKSNHAGARQLLEQLIGVASVRGRVARLLEPVYETDTRWRDLIGVLRVQVDLATSGHDKMELLARIAGVEADRLGENRGAFATWTEALAADPVDTRPRVALLALAAELGRWGEAAAALERALTEVDSGDLALRLELAAELARIYDHEVNDQERAISAYERLLAADPGNPETGRGAVLALARLYERARKWLELGWILRRQAEWADSVEDRAGLLARVALLTENELADKPGAITAWQEVLGEDGEHAEALAALERLYEEAHRWPELTEVLRRRVDLANDPLEKRAHLTRISTLYERQIGSVHDAVAARLEVLDYLPDDDSTLVELARLYRSEERFPDLLEILERRLAMASSSAGRSELLFELAELLHQRLGRDSDALRRYAQVIEGDPDHTRAIAAVEEMLESDDLLSRAAEVLEPLYAASGEHEKLAGLLLRLIDRTDDPRYRIASLRRVAEIRELKLGDAEGALPVLRQAVVLAVGEPELPELLKELERLAAALEREGDLIDIYREIVPDVFDGELQRRLLLDIADLARGVRNDIDLAREFYQKVLDVNADDERALAALENIYRLQEDWAKLHDILIRNAELAGDNLDRRARALDEAAGLCARELGRPEDAIAAWEQVLEMTPDNRSAAASLEKIYESTERWHDLTELIERRLGFAFTVEEAVVLRLRLAKIYEQKLADSEAAVENYSAVLGGAPNHVEATVALERYLDDPGSRSAAAEILQPIYVSRQDWPKLVRIFEIRLEAADDPAERQQLSRYIARLFEDQLEDLEGAFRWYGRVFREVPGDEQVRAQLVRLAGVLESWSSLANVYQEFLDDESGDTPQVRDVALAVAAIYDRRLGSVDRAHAAYRRVLVSRPDDRETFRRMEELLARAERWRELVDAYDDAVQAATDDEWRMEMYARMARTLETRLQDSDRAIDCYRAIVDLDSGGATPAGLRALGELDRLYQEQGRWFDLADLLRGRIDTLDALPEGEPARDRYRMRLAELLEKRLDDAEAAIDQYELLIDGHERAGALRELERLVVNAAHRERIARILEPIYRNNDEWKKLVVILDAQLEFVAEPDQRVAMLREIARIHETRGGVPRMALEALAKAWREDIADQQSYDELLSLAAKLGEWTKLISTFEAGIKDVYDTDLVVKVLSRIAEIHEANRDDPDAAIDTWRRVLKLKDDDLDALTALDTLLDGTGRDAELVKVIERRGELADDPAIRKVLLQRTASLYEESLGDKPAAIGAYKRVLEVDEADGDALDALERLYRTQQEYRELAAVLARKIELAETIAVRRPLQFALASVYETHLTDPYEAIGQMNAVLSEAADDREALAALDGLYQREAMWPDLLRVLDRRAEVEREVPTRAELRYRAAQLVEKEMMEPEEAIQRYAGVLEIAPTHNATRRALDALTKHEDTIDSASEVLERQYRSESNHDALAELYERRLARQGADPAIRQQQYATLADIHETSRGDDDAAFAVWARALVEAPEDEGVQGQLERLAGSRGNWEELAALYEVRLAEMVDPDLEHHYASRLGSIYEEALGDLPRAADKYKRALTTSSDEEPALVALSRIFERSGRWAELADVLARRAEASTDEDQQAEYLFRLGDVREQQLGDLADAMSAYSDVLDRDPHHVAARGALERMLAHESQRAPIIAILEPLYETEGDVGRLADLLVTKLTITRDALERAHIYARVTELAETRLADPTRALDAAGGWLEEDPQSEEALSELERLAEGIGRWGEVAARLSGIINSSESRDQRLPLMDKLGTIQLERLNDLEAAEATFKAVLAIEPESMLALERLEKIYRTREDTESLCEVLWRRGELAFDAPVKRDCFAQVARLREQTHDDERAIEAWRHVIDLEEGDREAHRQLAAILDRQQRWQELIDLLHVTVRFSDRGDEVAVRTRIAGLYTDKLGELDRAAEAWQAVLDSDPSSRSALEALETVQRRRKDWLAVQEALARQLDLASDRGDKIGLLQRLAAVAETERESADEAIGYLQAILDIDNGHAATYDALEKLLRKGERWHELVDLFERAAEVQGAQGDGTREIEYLARAADVWEGPLENPDAAGEILEKILNRDPRYVPALTRLAKLYESQGDWDKCGEVLEKALALGPTGSAAAELHYRLGEVARERSGDIDGALQSFQRALGYESGHAGAAAAVEAIARDRDDWATVADMLGRRLGATTDEAKRLEQTLELAQLYADKLDRPDQVVPLLELAARTAPSDARIIGPLADAYFAAGRHVDAAPMYETLAEDAKKGRRMKDVAKYRQRAGGIFEAQNDIEKALAAYEEAFRIDPTNVTTMAGLGRIYMDRSDWEKARRVYRSMVLQNIDPEVGITKAIVYYNLGLIHLHLDEAKQAKGMFQRGLELEPDNAAIKQALAEL